MKNLLKIHINAHRYSPGRAEKGALLSMNIQNVTLYGSGLIGCGWAVHLLCCDFPSVTLYDLNGDALVRARERVTGDLAFLAGEGVLTRAQAEERVARLRFTTDRREALAGADLIQENCPENLELKRAVMADIEALCRPDAVIASSTSGISATLIARDMIHPERMVGAHPYHPVYLLPLIELVKGERTGQDYLDGLVAFYRSIRKEPVVLKKECPGYIASRLMSVLFRESTHLIQSGVATMEDIDTAFTYGPGMRYGLIGINMTLQLTGGDHGLAGALFGGIGTSGGNWMESFANFTRWPEDYLSFWQTCQEQMNGEMARRDELHGRTNPEIERFRDRGLVQLLRHHGKL